MSHDSRHARLGRAGRVRRSVAATVAAALTAAVLTVADPAAGQPGASGVPDLFPDRGTTRFIVHLATTADLSQAATVADRAAQGWYVYEQLTATAEASQAGLRAHLDRRGVRYTPLWIVNALVVDGDRALAEELAARSDVARIESDAVITLAPTTTSEAGPLSSEWNILDINAPAAWEDFGARGQGAVVATLGTGATHQHPALVNQYRGHLGGGLFVHDYNWYDATGGCTLAPCDPNGQSTHNLGVMVGDDGGTNRIGVAPEAKWIAARACTATGACSTSALLSAGQWLLAPTTLAGTNPDPTKRPHVIYNPWGSATPSGSIQAMVNAWAAAGILPVFPAAFDSSGCGSIGFPAYLPSAYTVTGYDTAHRPALGGRGPAPNGLIKPDVAAPAVGIRSAHPFGGYTVLSGTGVGAPHAAGVAALVWSAKPSLRGNVPMTRFILDISAVSVSDLTCGGTPLHNNVWGHGRLDAHQAVWFAINLP